MENGRPGREGYWRERGPRADYQPPCVFISKEIVLNPINGVNGPPAPLSFFGRGDSVKGDHQGPLSRAIKGRMFHRNMRVGPGISPGRLLTGARPADGLPTALCFYLQGNCTWFIWDCQERRIFAGDFTACGRRVTLPSAAKSPKRRWGRLRWALACP